MFHLRTFTTLCSALVVAGLPSARLQAQTVLSGTVREQASGQPLPGVEVVLLGYGLVTTTDAAGHFTLATLPRGFQSVLFRLVGYQPAWLRFQVGTRDTTRADASLVSVDAQQLEEIEVNAPASRLRGLAAFDERRRLGGFGTFIDSTMIRKLDGLPLTTLLRRYSRIDLYHVYIKSERRYEDWAVSRRERGPDGTPCPLAVILDGVPIFQLHLAGRRPPDLGRFDPTTLDAIEVYQSAGETPMELGGVSGGGTCGTLVLWTRRG